MMCADCLWHWLGQKTNLCWYWQCQQGSVARTLLPGTSKSALHIHLTQVRFAVPDSESREISGKKNPVKFTRF